MKKYRIATICICAMTYFAAIPYGIATDRDDLFEPRTSMLGANAKASDDGSLPSVDCFRVKKNLEKMGSTMRGVWNKKIVPGYEVASEWLADQTDIFGLRKLEIGPIM